MEERSMVRLALEHFEKPLLGAAILCALGGVLGFSQSPPLLDDVEGLEADSDLVVHFMQNARAELSPVPDMPARLEEQLDPGAVQPLEPFPRWTSHRRPGVLIRTSPTPVPPAAAHAPAQLAAPEVRRGEVRLSWTLPESTPGVLDRTQLELWRLVEGEEWQLRARLGLDETRFRDDEVRWGHRYSYQLRSRAELTPQVARDWPKLLTPALAEVRSKASEAVEPQAEVLIEVNSVTVHDPIRQPKGVDTAYLYVHRWDAAKGAFTRRGMLVEVGQPIGQTGATLAGVEVGERPHPRDGHLQRVQRARIAWPKIGEWSVSDLDPPVTER